jgi:cytochrome c oxidase subunit 3
MDRAMTWDDDRWESPDLPGGGRREANRTTLFLLIAGGAMLFTTFTASYLVRRESPDWVRVPLPPIAWAGVAVIALSSVTMELARRERRTAAPWVWGTIALGAVFAAGQVLAWRELRAAGVYAATSPHAAFFYMLTAVHAAHLAAGLGVLAASLRRAGRASLGACAAWWHFVGAAWVWVAFVLTVF